MTDQWENIKMTDDNEKCSKCDDVQKLKEELRMANQKNQAIEHATELAHIRLNALEEAARECDAFEHDHMICEMAKAAYRVAAARIRRLFHKKT